MRNMTVGAMLIGGLLMILGGKGGSVSPGPGVEKKRDPVNLTISLEDAPARAYLKAQAGYIKGMGDLFRELAKDADTFQESGPAAAAFASKSPGVSARAFVPWETYLFKTRVDGKAWSSKGFSDRCLEMAAASDSAVEALRPLLE